MLTLIHYRLCPYSRSIRLALSECGVESHLVEERPWDWQDSFLEINPAGNLPVLKVQDGPTLCGAYVISEYLDDAGTDSSDALRGFKLLPGDTKERAEVRRLVDWFHRKFDTEVSNYILDEKVHRRFGATNSSGPNMDGLRACYENLRYHLLYIGYLVDQRTWLAGDRMSFADLAAAGHLSCIDYLGDVPWDVSDGARNWYARIKSRPSFRALLADKIPGISPPEYYADPDF